MFVQREPANLPAEVMEPLNRIRSLTRKVRLRLSVQRALQALIISAAIGAALIAATLLLVKLDVAPSLWLWASLWVAGAGCLCTLTVAMLRRLSHLRAAVLLDEAGGFHDRLSSALAFSAQPDPTPMMQLAMADAAGVLDRAEPAKAAPWRWPRRVDTLALCLMALGLVAWIDLPADAPGQATPVAEAAPIKVEAEKKEILLKEDKEHLEAEKKRLEEELKRTTDPRLKAWLAKLNDLLRDLAQGKITPKEAFARIGQLRKAKEAWQKRVAEGLREIKEKLAKAAKSKRRAKQKDLRELRDALKEARLRSAAKALEKLADKAQRRELSPRERKRLGKGFQDLAKKLQSERDKRIERLKRERDRLQKKKKKKKDRFAKRDRDRLKKNKRELERLRRERKEASEARRTLDRLRRSLSQAAQELLRRQSKTGQPMSPQQMRKAAEMLRRLSQQSGAQKRMRMAEAKLIDIKEMLRRGGKSGKGGKNGKMRRFLARAQGKDGKSGSGKDGMGKDGEKLALLKRGGKDGQSFLLGPMGEAKMKGAGGSGKEKGDGIGEGHDPNVLGEKTKLNAKYQEDLVKGREGKGESKSRVVFSAATKGFAQRAYRRVHQNYSEVVEETMERQDIPVGKRRYVRRYFDMIRPR